MQMYNICKHKTYNIRKSFCFIPLISIVQNMLSFFSLVSLFLSLHCRNIFINTYAVYGYLCPEFKIFYSHIFIILSYITAPRSSVVTLTSRVDTPTSSLDTQKRGFFGSKKLLFYPSTSYLRVPTLDVGVLTSYLRSKKAYLFLLTSYLDLNTHY